MITGECNCGDIAFEITAKVSDVYVCHCSICRRATGSSGIAVIVVNNKEFSWVRGKELIKTWHKPKHDWQTSFCQNCGSSLPGANDESRMYVPAGVISSGADELRVTHHIYVDSKASWDEIADNGKQHREGFTG
ncbi:GFA family protein [Thalassomonas actiniarum]|uniref:GFA family protein n=1 Tax=Thalassomonas actiniarum TaxID=485447 RepID=A0AAE9YY46_9GAMM|nr:GFA family protein [Thalassomonas actiniarum]WDE02499.1 GFA family protein [Thalassomonas actiniarum]